MTRFFETRIETLKLWACGTGRINRDDLAELQTDDFSGSPECSWQNNSASGHVNLFCSLGDWACNVTDLLKDNRFDRFYFENEQEATVLFRHYTRILLVVSEMLTDFQDIYIQTENLPQSKDNKIKARHFFFPPECDDNITLILNFINRVCKHKTQHLHLCNNHAPIYFEDSGKDFAKLNHISIYDSIINKEKNAILMPQLSFIITTLLTCYGQLDKYFIADKQKFDALCAKYTIVLGSQ